MFVSQKDLNVRHLTTPLCQKGAERKRRCLADEEARVGDETAITKYGIPLAMVIYFKYLGRLLLEEDKNWPAVLSNLRKARRKWEWMTRVMVREGVDDWTLGQI